MSTPIAVNQEALLDAYLRAYDLTLESDNPDYDLVEKQIGRASCRERV